MEIEFTVFGEPTGKERPRADRRSGRMYTPKKTTEYESKVMWVYKNAYHSFRFPDRAMLHVDIKAYYSIPASDSVVERARKLRGDHLPIKKPDWDNIGKIICDALNGIAYRDDAQIVEARVRKYYSDNPRVVVTIWDKEA